MIRKESCFILVDGEPCIQLYSDRTYKVGEIATAEQKLKEFLSPLTNRWIVGYAWFDNQPDIEDAERENFFCIFLIDNRSKESAIKSFRHRLSMMDYENGILLN